MQRRIDELSDLEEGACQAGTAGDRVELKHIEFKSTRRAERESREGAGIKESKRQKFASSPSFASTSHETFRKRSSRGTADGRRTTEKAVKSSETSERFISSLACETYEKNESISIHPIASITSVSKKR